MVRGRLPLVLLGARRQGVEERVGVAELGAMTRKIRYEHDDAEAEGARPAQGLGLDETASFEGPAKLPEAFSPHRTRVDGTAGYDAMLASALEHASERPRMGKYVVLGTLGEGAMGTVLRAYDEQLDRQVALKVLHRELGEQQTSRLLREAQALAKVSHPNVVQVYEVGEVEGRAYVAMELIEGQTLRAWMRQHPRPDWRDVVRVFAQLGAGLAAVHERRLVHRDFKPGNALIDTQGRARVVDFGLVRRTDESEEYSVQRVRTGGHAVVPLDSLITDTGVIMGTPAYMSPEQIKEQDTDARSDQFSFCVVLYEALHGERPHDGDTLETLLKNITDGRMRRSIIDPSSPKHLHALVNRGLSVDPASRFPSMEALLIALEDFESRLDSINFKMLPLSVGLGIPLVMGFWFLDWFLLRPHVWVTLAIRCGMCSVVGVVFVLYRILPRLAERHVDVLIVGTNMITCWGLVAIVWIDGGLESYHVAGLNLLVLSIGVMYAWPLRRALLQNAAIYGSLMLPLAFVPRDIEALDVVLANQLFLLSTMLLSVAAQYQRYDLQHREFRAIQERRRLEVEVANIKRGGDRVSSSGQG